MKVLIWFFFLLGEGQFGKVYSCVNLDTEEVVAMKQVNIVVIIVLLKYLYICKMFYHRFQILFHPNDHGAFQDLADEIKAFEGLAHESLVKYYGCEVHRVSS